MKRILFILVASLIMPKMFAAGTKIGDLYYNLNSSSLTAEVTYYSSWGSDNANYVTGDIVIPELFDYGGKTYSVTSIGNDAFYYCTALTSIEIPNSVTSIGNAAFYGCDGLTSIEIPNSVTKIRTSTFSGCSDLTSIEIPNSVTSIGESAFRGCSSLTSIKIPNSVTSIGSSAFFGCSSLTSIVIPNSVTSIESGTFYGCSGLTSIEIPNSVSSIGQSAFYDCRALTSIEIPNSVTYFPPCIFEGCSSLTSIEIPNSVTSIGFRAFFNCWGLTSIEIPNSVTEIANEAFGQCEGLTSIEIPNSVTEIGSDAFYYCTALKSVVIPNSVTSIWSDSFRGCSGLIKSAYPSTIANPFKKGVSIEYPAESAIIEDGVIWGKNKESLYFVPINYEGSFEIPNSVTSIETSAFEGCTSLTSVEIPNLVTSIGDYAFSGCSGLQTITFNSKNILSLGNYAFSGCDNIVEIFCNTVRPPVAAELNVFSETTYSNAIVNVPEKDLYLYYTVIPWNKFVHINGITQHTELEINFEGSSSLSVGQSIQLTLSPKDMPNIILEAYWTSSDTNVAIVNQQGLVTAIAPGTTVIVASDAYGNNAAVTFTVKADDTPVEIPATGISITPSAPSQIKVGESLQLTATVVPNNTSNKTVTWKSTNNSVASVDQFGLVAGVSEGTAVVTASDAYGHSAYVIITVVANDENGVEAIFDDFRNLHIFNVNGILIKKDATPEDIENLTPGIYIIGGKKVVIR